MENLVLPTAMQAEWADLELGVLIHYDLTVFEDDYNFRKHWDDPLAPSVFAPDRLDTDQWLAAAASAGAKYAVLVAKHCTGFALWPTAVNDYSVKNSQMKGGSGDIVADFVASCKKYGIRPGIYYSASCNQYYKVENPGRVISGDKAEQEKYNQAVLAQLTELWSNYGELFEIWFDGGCIAPEQGGPDIASLLHKLQPNSVVFQGPDGFDSLVRWIGNEDGIAFENCSSIVNSAEPSEQGDTYGDRWCPAESDLPNRFAGFSHSGGWFYSEKEDGLVIPAEDLFDTYIKSVGRNTNMLLGMVIDKHGLFPEKDRAEFERFGEILKKNFGKPLASCDVSASAAEYSIALPQGVQSRFVSIGEDIEQGERITGYRLECGGECFEGTVIGHKRIFEVKASDFKLVITDCKAEPKLKFFEIY